MKTLDDLRLAAPRDLDPAAQRLWRHGDDTGGIKGRRETLGDPPVAGDLWIASAGEDDFGPIDLALVLITRVHEDGGYVLCIPVTTPDEPASEMAQRWDHNPLGVPLVLWPALETGVAFETLDRRLGDGLDAMTLHRVRRSALGDGPAPLPQMAEPADGTTEDAALDDFLADLCERMAVACYAHGEAEETA